MSDLQCPAIETLKNPGLHLWEDISESYWLLRSSRLTAGGIIVLYDKFSTNEEIDYIQRYINIFNIQNVIYSPIIFNEENKFLCQDDHVKILELIQNENYALLKYRGIRRIFTDKEYGKLVPILNEIAISLTLPNFRSRCEEFYLYYRENTDKLNYVYNLLHDNESKSTLVEILRAAAENDYYRLPELSGLTKYFDCYSHMDDEIWVNCGSCYGDTISNFLYNHYKFNRIFSIEGDSRYYKKLVRNIASLPEDINSRIKIFNFYIGEKGSDKSLDNLFKFVPVSLINMDIEGYEMEALKGARELIKKHRPVLAVCAYHKCTDLYDIPRYIHDISPDYAFFLRKYTMYDGNSFNEFLYYCVPVERIL